MRLTKEEILKALAYNGPVPKALRDEAVEGARAIERAVLEKVLKRMDEMENEMDVRPRWLFFEREVRSAAQEGEDDRTGA